MYQRDPLQCPVCALAKEIASVSILSLEVLTGQHMTTAVQKNVCALIFLQGQALGLFNTQTDAQPQVNNANYVQIMTHVNNVMFPQKVYITQTCWMRSYLKKPRDVKTCNYVTRVQ